MSTTVSAATSFRAAIEARDIDAAVALLADDVVFRSPAVFKPYAGALVVSHLLRTVFAVFEDFRYTDEASGAVHALLFEARVGDRTLQGIDLIRTSEDGEQITELTVMVRPLSGLTALVREMGARLSG